MSPNGPPLYSSCTSGRSISTNRPDDATADVSIPCVIFSRPRALYRVERALPVTGPREAQKGWPMFLPPRRDVLLAQLSVALTVTITLCLAVPRQAQSHGDAALPVGGYVDDLAVTSA